MEKRKLNSLYVLLGIVSLLLFNYPVVNLFLRREWNGIPGILFYFCIIVVLISVSGYLITTLKEK